MLELSTKYALKALLHLSEQPNRNYMQVQTLSEEAEVPGPYLAKIIKQLAARGIVETRRGISGGVRLPERNSPVSFHDVCVALDDPIVSSGCFLTRHACNSKSPCAMHASWSKIKKDIGKFLQDSKID